MLRYPREVEVWARVGSSAAMLYEFAKITAKQEGYEVHDWGDCDIVPGSMTAPDTYGARYAMFKIKFN